MQERVHGRQGRVLRVPDGVLTVERFWVRGCVGDAFTVTLESAGFGTGESIKEAPFVDLIADLARDCENIVHGDGGWLCGDWDGFGVGELSL